jgi:phosphate transport system protein
MLPSHPPRTVDGVERRHFETELRDLENRLIAMGGLAEERLQGAIKALVDRNRPAAEAIANGDADVNALQIEIDDRCLKLLALQQPIASDLRLITAAMSINADLERIGDQAVNIAENAIRMLGAPPFRPISDLARMGEMAEHMTRDSLDAFVRRDPALARAVLGQDDAVDGLKDTIFRVLLTHMIADPETIAPALALILISRNIERIADHATNIAEDVIFLVEARDVRHRHEQVSAP